MRFDLVTAFPDLVAGPLEESILKRAQQKNLVEIVVHDLRQFAYDKHRQLDDYPYGGGPGMVMKPEPFFRCVEQIIGEVSAKKRKIIFMSPQGITFTQKIANDLTSWDHLILLCGHYKGVDERVIEALVDEEISVGDYVLTGGELPALLVIDAVSRLIPGVISDLESANTDSFQQDLLDCPYYTRPEEYRGMRVPDVLLSGHHQKIAQWRAEQALVRTRKRRKDLLNRKMSEPDRMEDRKDG